MARAQDQRRWRANTARQRIEAYLPVDNIVQLDALAAARGASRATLIAALIAEAAPEAADPVVDASDQMSTTEPEPTSPVAQPTPASAAAGRYTFHRPRRAEDKRYEWIAETAEGTRIALGRDPVRYYRWRGVILDGSLYLREAKGNRREDVVAQLMQWL